VRSGILLEVQDRGSPREEARGKRPGGGRRERIRGVFEDAGQRGIERARGAPSGSTEWLR